MGIVACVFLHRVNHSSGSNWRHIFELPEGMDVPEARALLDEGLPVHGRMMEVERPTKAEDLGLSDEGGETIRMIREEWDWTLVPAQILSLEPWIGARIGRWDDQVVSSAPPRTPWTFYATKSRLVPGGEIVVTELQAWSRPTTPDGEEVGIVVWVQSYDMRSFSGKMGPRRGHERFIHYHFQVEDVAIRNAQDLVALLDAGCSVRGWRVGDCPSRLEYSVGALHSITHRTPAVLRRDDVRMLRPVGNTITLDLMETAE